MSAAIVAALKKIALAVAGNPKVLKKIGGIILGVILIIAMPAVAVIAIFSGDFEINTEQLQEMVQESMTEEEQSKLQLINDTMISIEEAMIEAEYTAARINEAEVLYSLALWEFSSEEDFVERMIGCFASEQTDEQLVFNINAEFGTQIQVDEFSNIMGGIRSAYIETDDYYDTSTKNNIDLVKYAVCAEESSWGYVWGTYGTILTEDALELLCAQYPSSVGDYTEFIKQHWLGGRTTDCSGLIKGYVWLNVDNNQIEYGTNGLPDLRADEIYDGATEKGEIDSIPDIQGLAVWKQGHIGVYVGNGQVIEAKSTEKGIIRTNLADGTWTHWLKVPGITYIEMEE